MKRELFDIWEDPNPPHFGFPIAVQMVNYVGYYRSQTGAESFVEAVKKSRAQDAKSGVSVVPTKKSK